MASKPGIVVLISGSGTNLQAIIDTVQEGLIPGELRAVISNRPGVAGLEKAQRAGITTHVIDHRSYPERADFDRALMQSIDGHDPALVVLAGFMRVLTPEFVDRYQGRLLNVHPSLLPAFRGLHTHERALESGIREHGCSIHFVNAELDGGPVIAQAIVPVLAEDTPTSLAARVQQQEHRIYPMVVAWFCEGRLKLLDGKVCLDGKSLPAPLRYDSTGAMPSPTSARRSNMGSKGTTLALVLLFMLIFPVARPVDAIEPSSIPRGYSAEYQAHRLGLTVEAKVDFRHQGDRYVYETLIQPRGLLSVARRDRIIERSVLEMGDDRLRNVSYSYRHEGRKTNSGRERVTEMEFDWIKGEVTGEHNGREIALKLTPDTVDRSALQLAMMEKVRLGHRSFSLQVVDRRRIVSYDFTVHGPETIRTPMGVLETMVAVRKVEERGLTVRTWFAPSLEYLPVRMEYEDDGLVVVMSMYALEWH